MSDANKTLITKQVTNAVVLWLSERGFRPIESEVPIGCRWCADVAGFAYLTRTEAKRLNLLPERPRWLPAGNLAEHEQRTTEWLRWFENLPSPITAAVEVKTSISDFQRDKKFKRDAPAHMLYLAMPVGMLPLDRVNERWGVLAFDVTTGKLKRVRRPQLQTISIEQSLRVVADVAMRRDNFTRYERFREFDRQHREHNNERENRHRISSVVSALLDIQSGRYGIDEAFAANGCRCKSLPKFVRERIERLLPQSESNCA